MKAWTELSKQLVLLTQFGISIIMPLLMCLFISWLLVDKCHLGGWVYILGFFFGLGSSGVTAWKMYLTVQKDLEKKDKKKKTAYNDHG